VNETAPKRPGSNQAVSKKAVARRLVPNRAMSTEGAISTGAASRSTAGPEIVAHRAALIEIYQRVNDELASLDHRVAHLHDHRSSDEMDLAQLEAPESVLHQLEGKQRRTLREVLAALERIESGSFGRCEHCGGSIAELRLEALPMARYCLGCQEQLEDGMWLEHSLEEELCA
jgi:RNA polymerase-binding protein DksA